MSACWLGGMGWKGEGAWWRVSWPQGPRPPGSSPPLLWFWILANRQVVKAVAPWGSLVPPQATGIAPSDLTGVPGGRCLDLATL